MLLYGLIYLVDTYEQNSPTLTQETFSIQVRHFQLFFNYTPHNNINIKLSKIKNCLVI